MNDAPQKRPSRPRVVIIGGGFGGLNAARALRRAPVEVTVVDRTNHHVFQPLLYQVATAALAPSDITVPIRWRLRRQRNCAVLLAEVRAVDVSRRLVVTAEGPAIPYDYLIVAAGARHAYFGHDDWEPIAPGLKTIEDALEIRHRFLVAFEQAEMTDDRGEREALQTFVVVGGGPTGVELAGQLPAIACRAMRRDFRRIDTTETRVLLLEGGPRVLPAFPPSLSEAARRDLEELGVQVHTGAVVTRVTPAGVWVGDEHIPARTVFWAAGNRASPLGLSLGVPVDRTGRIAVEPDLSVPGRSDVFVIGDLATMTQDGRPVPAVAPAAMQQGRAAARNIVRTIRGEPRRAFRYWNKGDLATIGRHKAVGDFGWFRIRGRLAWWCWLLVHIMYLAGFRNRLSVLLQWAYAYLTYQRGVRLIVGKRELGGGQRAEQPASFEANVPAHTVPSA
jgi:NADH dehydrogenase